MIRIGLVAVALVSAVNLAFACGTERWPVKTGADRDAGKVSIEPEKTTIMNLTSITAPQNPNSRRSSRFAPTELKVYQISGILSLIKKEKDEDYHLVITDADDNELSMIIESPAPHCAQNGAFLQQISDVRQAIIQKFGSFKRLQPNIPVTVTGVAFFDPLHGQEGVA